MKKLFRKFSENNYGEKNLAKTISVTNSSCVYTGGPVKFPINKNNDLANISA